MSEKEQDKKEQDKKEQNRNVANQIAASIGNQIVMSSLQKDSSITNYSMIKAAKNLQSKESTSIK